MGLCDYRFYGIVYVDMPIPFWYVVIGSFNDGSDYLRGGVYLWPRKFSLQNYMVTLVDSRLYIGFRVTIARTVICTVTHVLFTSMVAFAMSRPDLPARGVIYWVNMFTMFFGGGLIPFYILLKELHLINTFWVYVIPGLYSVYNMIICSNYFRSIPNEIHESAMIDGASEFRIFLKLYLPLSTPVLATVALLGWRWTLELRFLTAWSIPRIGICKRSNCIYIK